MNEWRVPILAKASDKAHLWYGAAPRWYRPWCGANRQKWFYRIEDLVPAAAAEKCKRCLRCRAGHHP